MKHLLIELLLIIPGPDLKVNPQQECVPNQDVLISSWSPYRKKDSGLQMLINMAQGTVNKIFKISSLKGKYTIGVWKLFDCFNPV